MSANLSADSSIEPSAEPIHTISLVSELRLQYGDFPLLIDQDGHRAAVVVWDHNLKLGTSQDGNYEAIRHLWVLTVVAFCPGKDIDIDRWFVTEGLSLATSEHDAGPDIRWISSWGDDVGHAVAAGRLANLGFAIHDRASYGA